MKQMNNTYAIGQDVETTGLGQNQQFITFAASNGHKSFKTTARLFYKIIPEPAASLVNDISILDMIDPKHASLSKSVRKIHRLYNKKRNIIIHGFNNKFDDGKLTKCSYIVGHPPFYISKLNGNSPFCNMELSVMATALGVIKCKIENGIYSYKLVDYCAANGFSADNAHDALADVIYMEKIVNLIFTREPKFLDLRNTVTNKYLSRNILNKSDFVVLPKPTKSGISLKIYTPLGEFPDYKNHFLLISHDNLEKDLKTVKNCKNSKISIRKLQCNNGQLFLWSENDLINKLLSKSEVEEAKKKASLIKGSPELFSHAIQQQRDKIQSYEDSPYYENQMLKGFPSHSDTFLMNKFHESHPKDRYNIVTEIKDSRFYEILLDVMVDEDPQYLPPKILRRKIDETHDKLLLKKASWETIPSALEKIEELLPGTLGNQTRNLLDYRTYLLRRKARPIHPFTDNK